MESPSVAYKESPSQDSFTEIKFLVTSKHPEKGEERHATMIKISPLMLLVPLLDERVKDDPYVVVGKALMSFMDELSKEFEFLTLEND